MKSALIIEDCPDYREIVSLMLSERGFAVWEAESVAEAFSILHSHSFELILCDLHLPFTVGESQEEFEYSHEVGIRTAQELRSVLLEAPIVLSSATPRSTLDRRIDDFPFLQKPYRGETLDELLCHLECQAILS